MWMILWTTVTAAQTTASNQCSLDGSQSTITGGWYKIQGDMVNLRAAPSTNAAILEEIPLASTAKISSCAKKQQIGGKSGCWHKVKSITTKGVTRHYESAYLYFTAFATCYIAGDFDEDGVIEEAFLSATGYESFQVRLSDPNARVPMTWVVEEAHSSYTTLSSVPKSKTGRTMVKLSLSPEACGYTGYDHYYIYDSKGSPRLHKAISEQSFSDSPIYYNTSIKWNGDGTLVYKESHSNEESERSSKQKHCLSGFKYEPCGIKVESTKASHGM